MALLKNIESAFGVDFTYWKLEAVNINHKNKSCMLTLKGFINKDIFLLKPNKNISKIIQINNNKEINAYDDFFSPIALSPEGVTPQKQAYLYIKTLPEFANSVDIDV
jgi:hypothetical protein